MAAVAVASSAGGQTSKRKSRRALAQSFLSRISLDGNIVLERSEPASGTDNPLVEGELAENVEEEENKLLSSEQPIDGSSSAKTITNNKPKFMHSVSENAASFDRDKGRIIRSRDSNSVSYSKTLLTPEVVVNFRRSYSMTESLMTDSSSSSSGNVHFNKGSIRHRITCMSGSSFKLRRKLHDKRIVLCSPRKVPFLTYSVLKYHKENKEVGVEGTGRKRASAPNTQYLGIEGVEIGTGDKTVSYSSLLVPSFTNIKYVGDAKDGIPLLMPSVDSPTESCFDELEYPIPTADRYEPYKLDDPELTSGKHRTVLQLSSYMVSVTAYAKPSELKKDLNERFREKFPHIDITLTKLRSLKKDLLKVALFLDCQLDLTTVAYAYVYFEKLILKGKINKPNRKLVAGSCLLLAAKFNDDKRVKIKDLIEKIEDKLKTQVKELLSFEFQALVGLEFNLHLPTWEVIPHLRRLETEQQ